MPSCRLTLAVLAAFILAGASGGCSRDRPDLNAIPATFAGTLKVEPQGRSTKDLYDAAVRLGRAYGLRSDGDGATGGREWQVQFHCTSNYAADAVTVAGGDLVLFQASPYAFARTEDYERFKADLLALMRQYGQVTHQPEKPPLDTDALLARGRHMGMDVMSRCSPQAAAPPADSPSYESKRAINNS